MASFDHETCPDDREEEDAVMAGAAEEGCAYEFRQLELSPAEAARPPFLPEERARLPYLPLIPQNYQLFIERFLRGHERVLAAYAPGAGKSIVGLLVAHTQQQLHAGHVYILGFAATRNAFQKELLRRPEFGFVSLAEMEEYKRLRQQPGTALAQFEQRLRRRLSAAGGRFHFFGYMEFYNRLFGTTTQRSVADLQAALLSGDVAVNWPLLRTLSGGLLVCDEIHQAYNSVETNLYGLAIRLVSQVFSDPDFRAALLAREQDPALKAFTFVPPRMLFLSGTPVGSAPEVVDLLNLLLPVPVLQARLGKKLLERADLFGEDGALRPGAEFLIRKLAKGYTAYLGRLTTGQYPRITYAGTRLPGSIHVVRCPMLPAQAAVYNRYVGETLPPEATVLLDLVYPGLEGGMALLHPAQLRRLPPERLLAAGLELPEPQVITGTFLAQPRLRRYSAKYGALLESLFRFVRAQGDRGGKIMLLHPLVRGSGVLLVADLLRRNGILEEGAVGGGTARCNVCARPREGHPADHPFVSLRFTVVHGDLEEGTVRSRLAAFDALDNLRGQRCRIILGSKVIGQGVDFTALRQIYLLSLPESLFEYQQWVGRGARNGSHSLLPPEERTLEVLTLVATPYEERTLVALGREYSGRTLRVQQALFSGAVDLRVTMPLTSTLGSARGEPTDALGTLQLRPPPCGAASPLAFQLSLFEQEVRRQVRVIKRLLARQRIYRERDLWAAVRDPPFYVPVRVAKRDPVSEDAFRAALALLSHNHNRGQPCPQSCARNPGNLLDLFDDGLLLTATGGGAFLRVVRRGEWVMAVADPAPTPDAWSHSLPRTTVDITARLAQQPAYEFLKLNYLQRYRDASNEQLLASLELYDISFHQHLLEDAIAHTFAFLTQGRRTELHDFYLRMLYFYYRMDLVLYADLLPAELAAPYAPFLTTATKAAATTDAWQNAFLLDSITKTTLAPPVFSRLEKHKAGRVPARLLPVGHYILPQPRLFHPESGWREVSLPRPTGPQRENDLIVGYYEKSPGTIELKFKLRSPRHKIVHHRDTRMIERGYICLTCKREELEATAALLDLRLQSTTIRDMCSEIKLELMRRELSARRRARHNVPYERWFYMHYENPQA